MGKVELYYKGMHQANGLMSVQEEDVEKYLATGDFVRPGEINNDKHSDDRIGRSPKRVKN